MIHRIEALFYKGFKYIHVNLQPFNILIGPNASGKSSLLDILLFLKDVLNNGPVAAVEKRCGSFRQLVWNQERDYFEIAVEFQIPTKLNKTYRFARYEIALSTSEKEGIIIENENLWLIRKEPELRNRDRAPQKQLNLFPREVVPPSHIVAQRSRTPSGWRKIISKSAKGNDYFRSEKTNWNITYRFGPHKASLARIPEDENRFPISLWVKTVLMEGVQFLQLNSIPMRWPCRPDASITLQHDGSNLPKVIQFLQKNYPKMFKRWVQHIQTALPDVQEIQVQERPEDRYLYLIVRYRNSNIPSWLLSDGTLRLLAHTIIAYLPEQDRIYIIEEPENGLHPLAIETVMQSLSSVYHNQVILATHSPVILRLAEPKDILCFSKTESGAIDVVWGPEHPGLKNWKKGVDLATLHAAGILQ